MPPKKHQTGPETEALILAEATSGELYVRNFEDLSETDQLIERSVHELNTLALFGAINRKETMIRHPGNLGKSTPEATRGALEGLKKQRAVLTNQATETFYASIGHTDRRLQALANGDSTKEIDRDARRQWTNFQLWYRRPEHADARTARIRELRKEIKYLRSNENREQGLRPHLSDEQRVVQLQPVLTTRERLVALRDDPRARFMPTTNREKNVMLSWLDYLDNPEYPLGVNNQLLEVFNRQANKAVTSEIYTKRELPDRTVRSIVYELHDYWTNAAISLDTLKSLEIVVDSCVNQRVTLAEEAGGHPGLRALIRYRDLERLREQDQKPEGIRDALVAKEDRRPHVDPQKNKTVEDMYTRRVVDPKMADYIEAEADTITIHEARSLLARAIVDQENREMFLRRRLEDIQNPLEPQRYRSAAALAGRLITSNRIPPIEQTA